MANAAALHKPAGSTRAFLDEAALPAIRALNGARARTLLRTMHRVVNAARPGLPDPEAALYGYWMQWRTSNQSGRPLSMADTLWLTGDGSATFLHSSDRTLLHSLRMRLLMVSALYLNQAQAT